MSPRAHLLGECRFKALINGYFVEPFIMVGTVLCSHGQNYFTAILCVFQGALVSALADDSVHLWNLRQKRPAILHSLKFNRER